jgi:hypothetical protein
MIYMDAFYVHKWSVFQSLDILHSIKPLSVPTKSNMQFSNLVSPIVRGIEKFPESFHF